MAAQPLCGGGPDFTVTLEPREGGRIVERTAAGVFHQWGWVVEWAPPQRLVYRWHLAGTAERTTRVAVHFHGRDGGTLVRVEQDDWEALGADAATWRERNTAGWGGVLPHFVTACAGAAS